MSQTTTFDEIPYDWLKPGTYIEARPNYANMGLVPFPARAILFVQMLATGIATAKTLYRITRAAEGTVLFGAGSVGADMVTAFKTTNRTNDVYAIALPDADVGQAATGSFTFSGSGTGTVALYIGDVRVRISASATSTPAALATAAATAINALASLPLKATAAADKVTLVAKHKGEVGNTVLLSVARRNDEVLPSGLTVAVESMTGGTGNPEVQELLDAITNEWFTDIACAWSDAANQAALAGDLANRFKAMGKKDGHAYLGASGTFGEMTAKGAVTNSPHLTLIGGKRLTTAPWQWAAALCGLATFHLTNDPARQLRSLAMVGVMAPATEDLFTEEEQNLLLGSGVSTFDVLPDGTVTLDRVVTTYKVSNLNVTDRAWLDIMVPKTMTRVRYDWAAYVTLMYPRCKLADDDSAAAAHSDAVVTPKRMHASWAARCSLYERNAWIENTKRTIEESSFWRKDSDRNRLEANQQIVIIGNLMVLAAALEFQV